VRERRSIENAGLYDFDDRRAEKLRKLRKLLGDCQSTNVRTASVGAPLTLVTAPAHRPPLDSRDGEIAARCDGGAIVVGQRLQIGQHRLVVRWSERARSGGARAADPGSRSRPLAAVYRAPVKFSRMAIRAAKPYDLGRPPTLMAIRAAKPYDLGRPPTLSGPRATARKLFPVDDEAALGAWLRRRD
jgi:hypothetical protein